MTSYIDFKKHRKTVVGWFVDDNGSATGLGMACLILIVVMVFLGLVIPVVGTVMYPFAWNECRQVANLNDLDFRTIWPSGECVIQVSGHWITSNDLAEFLSRTGR